MSRRKKKHHDDEHMDETWLVPYSDLLTLLLALFIVMFAMSSVDAQKFQLLSRAFNQMFTGGTGLLNYQSPTPQGQVDAPDIKKKDQKRDQYQSENPTKVTNQQVDQLAKQRDQEELKALQAKVNTYIQKNNLINKLQTSLTNEGLLVTIRDNVLFDSGSADVRNVDIKTANEIGNLLIMNPPRNIIISGHTDNVPIKNSQFESNWELSVMRAVNFMKIVLKNDKLDPRWFSAKGYGEYQPVASNATADGRSKNRRVEILILPRTGS
ncbi:MAG: flagellar motor protein MotB [Bacillota bacterium]|nr:flagellar motor protein MotB [Bacillota bacterium]